jgi:two-component SAPR family response regulator
MHSSNPLVALSNFKADFYDLVILDIKMQDMNGFELYKEMRKIDPHVKALFFTASETYYEIWNRYFQHLIKSSLL